MLLPHATVDITQDSTQHGLRTFTLQITPQRPTNIIQLASNSALNIERIMVAEHIVSTEGDPVTKKIEPGFFFKQVLSSPFESVTVTLTVNANRALSLKVYETSYDLLLHLPNIKPRGKSVMPEPFLMTDATIIRQSIAL